MTNDHILYPNTLESIALNLTEKAAVPRRKPGGSLAALISVRFDFYLEYILIFTGHVYLYDLNFTRTYFTFKYSGRCQFLTMPFIRSKVKQLLQLILILHSQVTEAKWKDNWTSHYHFDLFYICRSLSGNTLLDTHLFSSNFAEF